MQASELVDILKELIETFGDKDVQCYDFISYDGECEQCTVTGVDLTFKPGFPINPYRDRDPVAAFFISGHEEPE